jgi:hypothetical protein
MDTNNVNVVKDLDKMSSREIVCLVENITGEFITTPLKNKKSIVAKAKEIFKNKNIPFNPLVVDSDDPKDSFWSEISPTKIGSLSSQSKQTGAPSVYSRVKAHKAKEIIAVIREYEELTKKNLASFKRALLEIDSIQ